MPKKQNARPYYNTNNIIYYYIITIITWGVVLKNTRKRRKNNIMLIGEGRVWGVGGGGGWVVGWVGCLWVLGGVCIGGG
jgi:hypothetical protein